MKKFIALLLLASISFCSFNTESQASPTFAKSGASVTKVSVKHKHHKKKHHRKHKK